MTSPLYGIDPETFENAQRHYQENETKRLTNEGLKTLHAKKQALKTRQEFFKEETPDNRKWLIKEGFLEEEEIKEEQIDNVEEDQDEDEYIEIPASVLENLMMKLETLETQLGKLKKQVSQTN